MSVEMSGSKSKQTKKKTCEVELTSDMESVRLNDRSCRFVMTDVKPKSNKTSRKLKNRHPTDPLPLPSNLRPTTPTDKKLTLSSSDSHLANKSASSASDCRINRKKAASVSGSSINIPVAFPSNHNISAHANGVLDESIKTPKVICDADSTPGGSSGKGNRGQRTPKKEAAKGFESYMMLDQVQQGMKKGELIEGVLRINPKNYQDAYISVPGGRMDICLGGIVDRNRALNGDVVVVQLKPKEMWRPKLWNSPRTAKVSAASTTNSPKDGLRRTIQLENDPDVANVKKTQTTSDTLETKQKKATRRGSRGGKGKKTSNEEVKEIPLDGSTVVEAVKHAKRSRRSKRGSRGGKGKKTSNEEVKEIPLDGSTVVEAVKHAKRSRRSKKNRAAEILLAHNDTQVPCEFLNEVETNSIQPTEFSAKVEETVVQGDNLSSVVAPLENLVLKDENSQNAVIVDDLIDLSEPVLLDELVKVEDGCGESLIGESIADEIIDDAVDDENLHLDDIYYPGVRNHDVERTDIVDHFNWSELLSKKALEQLSVEELLRIDSARNFLQPTARVVYIVKRCHNLMARGHLRLLPDKNRNWALFRPSDHRFPFMRVPASSCPAGFFDDPDSYINTLFTAKIKEWTKPSYAVGYICRSMGVDGDVEAETSALLMENGVSTEEFPSNILDDLPVKIPFRITQAETEGRRDYRSCCVFTIDPSTARDLDDAISCDQSGDLLRVAVHIADVSHFVVPSSKIDIAASRRATSVYLTSQVIPMLPQLLCEELCSLRAAEDRLTFSVEWTIRESDGAILSEWFGKSVIRSCAKLSYDDAQSVIDDESCVHVPGISSPWSVEDVRQRIKALHALTVKLRRKRVERGALRLDQSKLTFEVGCDGLPEDVGSYKQRESNRLIEELMLLANIAVARRIYKAYPHLAVLRMHPQPVKRSMDEVVDMLMSYGIHLDSTTSFSLQASLNNYVGEDEMSLARHQLITYLLTKPMKLATYFCSGAVSDETQFAHYALSVPLYTHFTSPIRRYPDILVHRLLAAALNDDKLPHNPSRILLLQQQLAHCNLAKSAAKNVSDKCSEIYLAAYVRKLGSFETDGIVCGLMDQSFDVLLYKMAIVKRVYCNQINTLDRVELEEEGGGCRKLKLIFDDGVILVITLFTRVKIMLIASEEDSNKLVACLQCVL